MVYNVNLQWVPTNASRTAANIYRNVDNAGYVFQADVGAGASYSDGPFNPSQVIKYYVTEVVNGLESGPSNEVTVTMPPAPPTGLTATVVPV